MRSYKLAQEASIEPASYKSREVQTVSAREGMEKKEPPYTAGENANSYIAVETGMEGPQNTKDRIIIRSSNPTPGHISEENHNLRRYSYPNVHCSTI